GRAMCASSGIRHISPRRTKKMRSKHLITFGVRGVKILAVAAVISTFITGRAANAALLAYEGFDYTPGLLTGQNGGTGFSSAWLLNGGNTNNSVVATGGFSYTDSGNRSLVVAGNRAWVTGDGSTAGDNFSGGTNANAQPLRPFSFQRGLDNTTNST